MTKKTSEDGRVKATWKGYADYELTPQDIDSILNMKLVPDDFIAWLDAVTTYGHKFALEPVGFNDGYKASLYAQYTDMVSAGIMLTAQGPDLDTAIKALWFKADRLGYKVEWPMVGRQAKLRLR